MDDGVKCMRPDGTVYTLSREEYRRLCRDGIKTESDSLIIYAARALKSACEANERYLRTHGRFSGELTDAVQDARRRLFDAIKLSDRQLGTGQSNV